MAELPGGEVTFLFTDIEGSTRRWEVVPEAMVTALPLHHQLLQGAFQANKGHVFATAGDSFSVAFADPGDAAAAAVDSQRALADADWGAIKPLRVRMAVHTGYARLHEGDYFGQPLNRTSRILSAARGGQIVLSQAVVEKLEDRLPTDTELHDMGSRHLPDLISDEHLYELAYQPSTTRWRRFITSVQRALLPRKPKRWYSDEPYY